MIMAPSSDEALQREVSSQAAILGNLDYRGFIPYRNIGDFYRRSRLVVHTSHIEGFPNVFLQAWQCGSPVVSIRVDPDGVIARHGLGRVSGSVPGVIADVRALLADESRRAAIGDVCRENLIRTHSPDAVIDQYLDYFEELGVRGVPSHEPRRPPPTQGRPIVSGRFLLFEASDFVSFPAGGQLTMARHIIAALPDEVALVGVDTDRSIPIGSW